ncbi:ribosome biogenesis GTPase YlqF [Cocleimonas flava]|uniref:Ribosome biogenesis GTPase A n=1 Tax=Cocleimonas flava TaxID=634765 RepID=A0A4R1EWX9_9GAMM|nr:MULTISPECIES: ribosome biogenesis GTPase YlqF [Cocleimonas]MEB8433653.1 ribosome biogenesis GTPase YlqF [Cocleimonas sp. KMM 6892]MEC4716464.1 ribosome biogenesis GTPase YlqF [Cocleimonas sp. KMM 6895]MEC4745643.1 ribosome biogenesis GTPase YlqF [Cocleimonas sp. KMM 6896]TCJ85300.1 ribosome biogenesis GTPase A [Cocleimonas flava]
MKIQWFPGHMHRASKEIREKLPEMDLLIEVLDARLPGSSENPMIAAIRNSSTRDIPCIKIFNKSDLADPELTEKWQAYYERDKGIKTLCVSREQPEKIKQISSLCRKMVTISDARDREIHAMIVGIPNVGKSTIINTVTGRTIAKTGNEAAVTRQQQRIKINDDVVLFDTPGLLWGNINNEHSGYRLAISGAIKDTAFESDDAAFYLAEYLIKHYPELLTKRYELSECPQTEIELIEIIGRQRGCLRSGGQVEIDKACKILINEFRLGTLGRITLEEPISFENENITAQAESEKKIEDKKATKAERKKRWRKNRK